MNKITKKSFYSFLTLYLVSSFIFLTLASYWFYSAQISMEMNANFYKMHNISNKVTSSVISAEMMQKEFTLDKFPNANIALFDANKKLIYGELLQELDFSQKYYKDGMVFSLISKTLAGHHGIEYIVVQSRECVYNIQRIKNKILYTAIISAFIIIVIAVFLSYIFLRPIRDKMQEVEKFIQDTTHELNTPLSALMMSTSRIKEKKTYDEKIITNISISTKQLYEMYASLTFLNFDNSREKAQDLDFTEVVQNSLEHFDELMSKKNITLDLSIGKCTLFITPTKAKMLINNLLGNAIKFSPPNTKITIHLDQKHLSIQDEGIGIKQSKLNTIFKCFNRATEYAGGFGIGLHIVASIVNEYNYKIDIKSKENEGTKAIIEF